MSKKYKVIDRASGSLAAELLSSQTVGTFSFNSLATLGSQTFVTGAGEYMVLTIEDEQIECSAVTVLAGVATATIETRGFNGTTAATHAFGSTVLVTANAGVLTEAMTNAYDAVQPATDTTFGAVKMSTDPADPAEPIAVGDNDTRMLTQDENDAAAGTSGSPSGTNKFVTDSDPRIAGGLTTDQKNALTGGDNAYTQHFHHWKPKASNTVRHTNAAEVYVATLGTKAKETAIASNAWNGPGVIRVKFDAYYAYSNNGKLALYKNGSDTGNYPAVTGSYQTFSYDITASPGDLIQVYEIATSGYPNSEFFVKNLLICFDLDTSAAGTFATSNS